MNCLYGLSGYSIRVSLADPSAGKIVSVKYPPWAVLNSTSGQPSASVTLSAVDLTGQIDAGAQGVELASITIHGDSTGSTGILITQAEIRRRWGGRSRYGKEYGGDYAAYCHGYYRCPVHYRQRFV